MLDRPALTRFFKYSLTGVSTLFLDLCLLYLFTDFFHWHYLFSAGAAFFLSTSLNHVLARRYVFGETERSLSTTYMNFLIIGGVGVALVTGLMYLLVEWFGVNYVWARLSVAGVTGMWNYLINLYYNFQVAGKK